MTPRLALSVGWLVMGLLPVQAPPADAHPFGEPQSVRLEADGSVVSLTWSAAPDDLLALGGAVGALAERRRAVFDIAPGGEPDPVGQTDADRIMGSPAMAGYLADHLAVYQEGRACPADVSLAGLLDTGARITFACSEPIADVEVEITMLTDLHQAYRTVAVGPEFSPDRALYTATRTTHTWSLGASDRSDAGPVAWLVGGAVAAILVAGGGAWLLLGRGRRGP